MLGKLRTLIAAGTVVALTLTTGAGASHASLRLVSPGTADIDAGLPRLPDDGSRVFFGTAEALVASDTDATSDIYAWSGGSLTLLTVGTGVGAAFKDASADGSRVFIETNESIVPADIDGAVDIYAASDGSVELLSGGSAATDVEYRKSTHDGSRVFFETTEALVPADADADVDVYEASTGAITLLSPSAGPAFFRHASADGSHVIFTTGTSLTPADTDTSFDLYDSSGGTLTLLTPGTSTGATFQFGSSDGTRVLFESVEGLDSDDVDTAQDLYLSTAGGLSLVTPGSADLGVQFRNSTPDAERVFFLTEESLDPADANGTFDLYAIDDGVTTYFPNAGSNTNPKAISADGSLVVIDTPVAMAASDTDAALDLYAVEYASGAVTLLSGGTESVPASYFGASQDGTRVFFVTTEQLAAVDTDAARDLYEGAEGSVHLLTADTEEDFLTGVVSPDGSRVYTISFEPLAPEDIDAALDVYEISDSAPTFADVPPTNTHYADIERLYDLGITQGCGQNGLGQLLFCPTDSVPREQMAAFLVRAKGLSQLFPATPTFADVPASSVFYGYIERLYEQGITQGCGSSGGQLFCPRTLVPREQMAAFIVRAKGLTQLNPATPTFADVPASSVFYGYVERLVQQGITQGCGVNGSGQPLFCPSGLVSRQQMASFLIRAFATP